MFGGWYYGAYNESKAGARAIALVCGPFATWQEVDAIKDKAREQITFNYPASSKFGPVYVLTPEFVAGVVNSKVWANYQTKQINVE